MQTALQLAPPLLSYAPTRKLSKSTSFPPVLTRSFSSKFSSIRVTAMETETPVVDYSSSSSVFPAEACETNGGDSCLVSMYPEVKLKPVDRTNRPNIASEPIERDYLDYCDPRTVLLGEACDVLGGEFCESPYQTGIY
ncbi:light-regulated protein 1 [Forsythia ovata]|uniref:Light-regulated protein 1 n=1 Tax=Forsythia ovata TaxID=205694 RepID=A0ABD1UXY6_9LAMI